MKVAKSQVPTFSNQNKKQDLRGLQRAGVRNHNKGGVSVCLRLPTFARVCLRFRLCACLRLSTFVCVCLRLFALARICLRPPLLRPPLRDTEDWLMWNRRRPAKSQPNWPSKILTIWIGMNRYHFFRNHYNFNSKTTFYVTVTEIFGK